MSTRLFNGLARAKSAMPGRIQITVVALFLGVVPIVQARQIKVRIQPSVDSPGTAAIEVVGKPLRRWSFRNDFAGVSELGRRVTSFSAFDAAGSKVQIRQLAPGEFETNAPAARFIYDVNLAPPERASDAARVSWLVFTRGLLLMADLLPIEEATRGDKGQFDEKTTVRFELPPDWSVHSSEVENRSGGFELADSERAVFAIGRFLRPSETNAGGMKLKLLVDGKWAFADLDVAEMAGNILKAHRQVFGVIPEGQAFLVLLPFPKSVAATQWSAETRGATVTLLMGELPSKVGALAQLSAPLTHELFHLWVPNALALEGDYDWFYEGFTIYEASQTGVKLGLLTFPEFLSSIARAYDSSKNQTNLSLVEASQRRFTGGLTSVYSKAQVVAFIYDLRLRNLSRNRRSLSDVYRKLMGAAKLDSARRKITDGNQVITKIISEEIGSDEYERRFIRNPVTIRLASELAPFGLKVDIVGLRTQISVSEQLSKQQRDLLRELGYNAATHANR
jgi:predicted metalloprotease with PDZ domain